jgi:hypothetical protein
LQTNDPRYWPYKDDSLFPGNLHHERSHPYGAVRVDERIIVVREFEGRYWPIFKYWHGYLERAVEKVVSLEKVA